MGQNQSHPEGGEVIVIDETLQILASRKCTNNSEAEHTRPLPPPRSREGVIVELDGLRSPKVSPPVDDTTGSTGTKRSLEEVDADDNPDLPSVYAEAGTLPTERGAQSVEKPVQSMIALSDVVQPSKKKKRLFANEQAVKAAQKLSEQSIKTEDEQVSLDPAASKHRESDQASNPVEIESTDPPGDHGEQTESSHVVKRQGPFVDDDSQDEGYYTYSPSSAETSFNEADGDELVKSLAKIHQRSYTSRPEAAEPQIPTPPDSPTLRKLQEEDDSAEQSRRLREQKLSGQAIKQDKHNTSTASSSLLDDDLILSDSDDVETRAHHVNGKDSKNAVERQTRGLASSRYRNDVLPAHSKRYNARVDSPESEDSELDHHLDVARSYKMRNPLPKPRLRKINPKTPSYRQFPVRSNPYSRHAAERYRTQDRHISTSATAQQPHDVTAKGNAQGEDRLRALTHKPVESTSLPQPLPSFNRSPSPLRRPSQKFHAIDLASTHPRRVTSRRAPHVDDAAVDSSARSSPLDTETLSSNEVPESAEQAPNRPLSMLEMMARRAEQRAKPISINTRHDDGPSLDLAVVVDIDYDDEDQVREEHERLKEQQKDLGTTEATGLAIASIRALGPLNAIEAKEEQEFQRFLSLVFDAKRSGRSRRDRMTKVRSNFERRSGREDHVAPSGRVREEYIKLLGAKRLELLDKVRDSLDDLVHEIGAKRKTLIAKRHNTKRNRKPSSLRKQVRFADAVSDRRTGRIRTDIEDGTVIDFGEPSEKKKKTRPLGKEAREMILLEEKLKLARDRHSNIDHTDTNSALVPAQEPESEISEEDSEAESVSGGGRNQSANQGFTASASFPVRHGRQTLDVDQDIEEINRLENERQHRDAASTTSRSSNAPKKPRPAQHGGQRPDPELIERMRKTAITRQTKADAEQPYDDVGDLSDSSEVSAAPVRSSSSVDTSSSDSPAVVQRFRYEVMGQFAGVDIYHPEEAYRFKRFFDFEKANDHVRTVVSQFVAEEIIRGEHKRVEIEEEDELLTIVVILGRHRVQGRVWIEKTIVEVDTGKIQAGKARRAILGEDRGHWAVDWEKTLSTTVTVEGAAATNEATTAPNNNGLTDEENDDLFGGSPSPPPPPLSPSTTSTTERVVVTHPSSDEILTNMYTSVAFANRKAKELFIAWFAQFCEEKDRPRWGTIQPASGSRYRGYLGAKDSALEGELERLGDHGLGFWEEEVVEEGETETLKVWVRRVGVQGPQN